MMMPFRSVSSLLLSSLTIVNKGSSLTIVKEGLSLTIVNETTNFFKTTVFLSDRFVFRFFVAIFIIDLLGISFIKNKQEVLEEFYIWPPHLNSIHIDKSCHVQLWNSKHILRFVESVVLKCHIKPLVRQVSQRVPIQPGCWLQAKRIKTGIKQDLSQTSKQYRLSAQDKYFYKILSSSGVGLQ